MLKCRDATRLLSKAQDRPLPLGDRLALRFHLMLCDGCRNFERQMDFLRTACGRYLSRSKDGDGSDT